MNVMAENKISGARYFSRPLGRRPLLTPDQVRRVVRLYQYSALTVSEIAALMGISEKTLYRYLDKRAREVIAEEARQAAVPFPSISREDSASSETEEAEDLEP